MPSGRTAVDLASCASSYRRDPSAHVDRVPKPQLQPDSIGVGLPECNGVALRHDHPLVNRQQQPLKNAVPVHYGYAQGKSGFQFRGRGGVSIKGRKTGEGGFGKRAQSTGPFVMNSGAKDAENFFGH